MASNTSVALSSSVMQAVHMALGIVMTDLDNRSFCRLDGLTPAIREQKRLAALNDLGLLEAEAIAVFDEATQTAARFLETPICILGIMTQELLLLKAAIGLSRVGLMNQLAQLRQIPRYESFCTYVVDSHQSLAIHDTASNPVLAKSLLVGHYGIRSYLGAPLLTADGQCLGTLAVMDLEPRCFTAKDREFLTITARWGLSEFERNRLLKQELTTSVYKVPNSLATVKYPHEQKASDSTTDSWDVSTNLSACFTSTNLIKVKLLTQLTQQLRTPLTSVMGMASVLSRQVYGPLTSKQKEYLEIIHHSGEHLVSLINEIVDLGILDDTNEHFNLMPVDIEMLCQQAINSLLEIAQVRQQQMRLSVEPGNRIWLLNKDKMRQLLYYLLFGVIQSAEVGSEVRIHVSRKSNNLNIAVWVFHPWLGDSMSQLYGGIVESPLPLSAAGTSNTLETPLGTGESESTELASSSYLFSTNQIFSNSWNSTVSTLRQELNEILGKNESRENLGLLLSCHLAALYGGKISVLGSLESGYRYVVSLPKLESAEERL